MNYGSGDYPLYPGSDKPALKVDFQALEDAALEIGVTVTFNSGGSYFAPGARLINIDTKIPNQRGFVSLGQLSDEYLHAWNQIRGRGRFLDAKAAKEHQTFGRAATEHGTRWLGTNQNAAFHKLEALNFILSNEHVPTFIWRFPTRTCASSRIPGFRTSDRPFRLTKRDRNIIPTTQRFPRRKE